MKFWEGNKISQEFDMSESDVARLFIRAMKQARRRLASPATENSKHDEDQILKLDNWPLSRTLRDWMTRIDGFNSVWDDEIGFEMILREVGDWRREDLEH